MANSDDSASTIDPFDIPTRDPNSLGLSREEFIEYALGIHHDANIESVRIYSESATIGIRVQNDGTIKGMFSCEIRFLGVRSARFNFCSSDIIDIYLEDMPDGLYRATFHQGFTQSEIQFADLEIADWSEYSEWRDIEPIVLQAQCKFPHNDDWFVDLPSMVTPDGRLKPDIL